MNTKSWQDYLDSSYLSGANAEYIEALYESYLHDPQSVDQKWRDFFADIVKANHHGATVMSHHEIQAQLKHMVRHPVRCVTVDSSEQQDGVDGLIEAYRRFGHLHANLNPLSTEHLYESRLELQAHGLSSADMQKNFKTRGVIADKKIATLEEIHGALNRIYCGTIGYQYYYISDQKQRQWLQQRIEHQMPLQFSKEVKRNILWQLTAAETLERYLDAKYLAKIRFSLEGNDCLIPMLDELTKRSAETGIKEIILGMAHRGRLNVWMNIMGKSASELFAEFEGKANYGMTSGDVKYHLGQSADVKTPSGPMHLSVLFNPSHLEFVTPVVNGSVRARQEPIQDKKRDYAMAVTIHGDASFSGQGVVMESLNMSLTRGYNVGGTIHIICNNQIGFTTSNLEDMRSSWYASDIGKMIECPTFHVNADDPEAVISVTQLALDFRNEFHCDVIVDLIGYRRGGHQEVDDPRATQPIMYNIIQHHPTARTLYAKQLVAEGVVAEDEPQQLIENYRKLLDDGKSVVALEPKGMVDVRKANWAPYFNDNWQADIDTGVPISKIKALSKQMLTFPEGFVLQRKVQDIMNARAKMAQGDIPLDWGFGEIMAYASLLEQGVPIRFTGEDSRRGTFFHRHAAVFDQKTGAEYMPLATINDKTSVQLYDSVLSEVGPMAFEYGYSTADPKSLIIWEAQYGDFANVGQVIIDQFLSSAWQKWQRLSGLVLLLPHGYEGAGPEHSSARLERFMQLAAQDNIQICVPTTPAQMFHLLRRQVLRPYRTPLIVLTPKSLLRHKLAISPLEDLEKGRFQLFIPEVDADIKAAKVRKVVLCSGKVYYDLIQKRRDNKQTDVAIVRIEQLYPFDYDGLKAILAQYKKAKTVVWCQEEPKNQGAWFCGRQRLVDCLQDGQTLEYAGREPMAAPAAGYPALNNKQQEQLVKEALE